jgi:hypothetical protein
LDPKKALRKGLRSISREEFIEVARLFAKNTMKRKNYFLMLINN